MGNLNSTSTKSATSHESLAIDELREAVSQVPGGSWKHLALSYYEREAFPDATGYMVDRHGVRVVIGEFASKNQSPEPSLPAHTGWRFWQRNRDSGQSAPPERQHFALVGTTKLVGNPELADLLSKISAFEETISLAEADGAARLRAAALQFREHRVAELASTDGISRLVSDPIRGGFDFTNRGSSAGNQGGPVPPLHPTCSHYLETTIREGEDTLHILLRRHFVTRHPGRDFYEYSAAVKCTGRAGYPDIEVVAEISEQAWNAAWERRIDRRLPEGGGPW